MTRKPAVALPRSPHDHTSAEAGRPLASITGTANVDIHPDGGDRGAGRLLADDVAVLRAAAVMRDASSIATVSRCRSVFLRASVGCTFVRQVCSAAKLRRDMT
jgi:hypothetical protein